MPTTFLLLFAFFLSHFFVVDGPSCKTSFGVWHDRPYYQLNRRTETCFGHRRRKRWERRGWKGRKAKPDDEFVGGTHKNTPIVEIYDVWQSSLWSVNKITRRHENAMKKKASDRGEDGESCSGLKRKANIAEEDLIGIDASVMKKLWYEEASWHMRRFPRSTFRKILQTCQNLGLLQAINSQAKELYCKFPCKLNDWKFIFPGVV